MTVGEIIRSLEDQAQDKDKLAGGDPESIFSEDAAALREAASIIRQKISIDERLKEEQHSKLRELHAKLDEVLEHEPADSGSEAEDSIWELSNLLKETLDDFFEEGGHDN